MIEIRRARPDDFQTIAKLAQEAHAFHADALPEVFQPANARVVSADDIAQLLAAPRSLLLVATVDGIGVGYAHAEVRETAATIYKRSHSALHVIAMAVAPSLRRQGIGRALLAAVRAEARALRLPELSLEVYAFNTTARTFYEQAGFASLREYLVAPV
jgi:ribosomal protein S18 acetylase RimI-like enzyme